MKRLLAQLGLALAMQLHADDAGDLAERHYQAGLALLAQSHFKDAAEELDVAGQLAPERADIKAALEQAHQKKPGALPVAAKTAEAPLDLDATQARLKAEPVLAEAKEAYRESELEHAADAWNRALLLDKDSSEAKAGLAKLSAEAYKKDADQPFDSSVGDLYNAALREARKERYVEAQKKLEEALSLNPVQGQVKELLEKIQTGAFAQQGSMDAEASLRQAEAALEAGDLALARQNIDLSLNLKPGNPQAEKDLALERSKAAPQIKALMAKAGQSSDEAAQALYRQVLAMEPGQAAASEALKKVQARLQQGRSQASLKQKVDQAYNDGVDAWQAGRLAEAATHFKDCLELQASDDEARKALDLVEAKLASQIDKDRAATVSLMQQGKDFEERGQLKEALDAYSRVAAKDQGNTQAAQALSRLGKELQGH
jgi:tetratricopeptide (TPR) repeat protein